MSHYKSEDIRNVAVVGHKGAGKTALIEAMLYLSKVLPRRGRAGEYGAGLDDTPEERTHQATLESRLVTLPWGGAKINIIDTPGEGSLFGDTRMALMAADAAILVISAKSGVETGTERLYRWIHDATLPCIVVLTKIDDDNSQIQEVLNQLRDLKVPATLMEVCAGTGGAFHGVAEVVTERAWIAVPETPANVAPAEVPAELKEAVHASHAKLVEEVAGTDDELTEHYLTDGDLSPAELDLGAQKAVASEKLIPVYCCSSTLPGGVAALLDAVTHLVPPPSRRAPWNGQSADVGATTRNPTADSPLSAFVFKTRIDPHVGKLSCVRVLSGELRPDTPVVCSTTGDHERVAQLLQGAGKDLKPLSTAVTGDMVIATKLRHGRTGDTLSDHKHPFSLTLPDRSHPLFSRVVSHPKGTEDKIANALQGIAEEDPGLSFSHDKETRDLILSGMGPFQLEIALERLRQRTSLDCRLGPPRIPYRETVRTKVTGVEGKQKKQSGGHGQFGVCYIDLEPLPRGTGLVFEDAIVGGSIPRQFIPSVQKGITKASQHGILAGYPVVDVKVSLVDGKFHSVDSSDAAFQVAGSKAFRDALRGAKPALLQPIVKLAVSIPNESIGDVIGDLNSRHGKVSSTDSLDAHAVITAYVPLANALDYEPALSQLTRGRGTFSLAFDHYDFCTPQVEERAIRDSGFKPIEED